MMNLQGRYSKKRAIEKAEILAKAYNQTQMVIPVIVSNAFAKRTSYKYDVITFAEWLSECQEWGFPLRHVFVARA